MRRSSRHAHPTATLQPGAGLVLRESARLLMIAVGDGTPIGMATVAQALVEAAAVLHRAFSIVGPFVVDRDAPAAVCYGRVAGLDCPVEDFDRAEAMASRTLTRLGFSLDHVKAA